MVFARPMLRSLLVSLITATLGSADATMETAATATSEMVTSSTTTSTGITTHTVQVGPKSNPHAYVPHNIIANPGDVVVFQFHPTNHSVVKADYLAPCVPAREGLFYSGMFDTFNEKDGQLVGPAPTWSIVVNDTKPTFFYCTAIGSCLENGMVGVINPSSSQTYESQYERALTYPYMLVPGQSMPAEGSTSSGISSTATGIGDNGGSSGGHSLSKGAIAGIAVACVVFVAILVALFFVLGRNRVYSQWVSSQDGRTERTARWALFNSQADPWNRKSELESNTTKTPTLAASGGSPDLTHRTFSPELEGSSSSAYGPSSPRHGSGHRTWDAPQNARIIRGPSELEAHSVPPQLPEMRDYR